MRRVLCGLVLSLMLAASFATDAQAVRPLPKAKLMAVYFWASWCPNCKLLTPEVAKARVDAGLDAKDVLFVTLDLSDEATIHQSVMLAQALGIASFVQAQGSATGYVAVLDAATKTELKRFDRTSKAKDIGAGIEALLGASR